MVVIIFKKLFIMKKLFVLFIIGSLFMTDVNAQRNEAFTTYTFSDFVTSSVNMVEANTLNSSLTVTGDDVSGAVVEMYVSRSGIRIRSRNWSDEEIKQYLQENYTIEVRVEGEKLLVAAEPKTNRAEHYNVSFKITVPRQMNTNLKTTNGSVQISNLAGSQKFSTVNGSLKVDNVSGKISGNTVNGSVTVTNSDDDITLSTVNGTITASDCDGKINLSTVNGRIRRERAG